MTKEKMVILFGGEHKDECIRYSSKLEACTFVVNQGQAFEAGFQMKVNCV
jgi:hypothetical protein